MSLSASIALPVRGAFELLLDVFGVEFYDHVDGSFSGAEAGDFRALYKVLYDFIVFFGDLFCVERERNLFACIVDIFYICIHNYKIRLAQLKARFKLRFR